uniref:Uncharacterized protein n=1 Tax=Gopherus agassizii TaxID=38772 RepID=A0A452GNB3_9SAUR
MVSLIRAQMHAGWGPNTPDLAINTYEALKVSFAREFNLSNCWICSQIPYHAAGLPWRAIPQNWSDFCQRWFTIYEAGSPLSRFRVSVPEIALRWPTLFQNCTQERQYALTNHTWFAGNSTCQFYLSPKANVSIPLLDSSDHDTGEGLQYFRPYTALSDLAGLNGMAATGQSFYICGRSAYKWLPHRWYGSCYLGFLAPPLRVSDQPPPGRPRQRRSLRATPKPIKEGDRMEGGSYLTYGIGQMAQLYRRLSVFLTQFANEILAIEESLSSELYQLRLLALQNQQALDYVLASQGGVCALIGDECCTYVPDNSADINRHILSAEQAFIWLLLHPGVFNWLRSTPGNRPNRCHPQALCAGNTKTN